jgi:hypothetical protein
MPTSKSTKAKAPDCGKLEIATIAGVSVYRMNSDQSVVFQSGMEIDADGAYRAYHPPPDSDKGLDYLLNAGHHGNWYGVVTDSGQPDGTPVVQRSDDPAPGFFVSSTALEDSDYSRTDPRRYVDSESVPYIVLPGHMTGGASLGDFAMVVNRRNGKTTSAICGDIGSRSKIGEASMATAKGVGVPESPRNGGVSAKIIFYLVFVGSGNHRPRTQAEIQQNGKSLFAKWGGIARVDSCFPQA